ncbi:FAD-dependent oxidoreductase [Streptomyces roseofulvus]|uniref:FAD-dependent oxidoreductase n=1 Tax=Streptomyces roseofulvus TaxID=33902 RepID=UPI0031FDF911
MWTAGFAVGSVAAASGLEVTGGRIVVDRTMRSVSHPDVYAVGDSVFTLGDNGLPRRCPARRPVSPAGRPPRRSWPGWPAARC